MPSSVLGELERDGTAAESDRDALLNVLGYGGYILGRGRRRFPHSLDWEAMGRINACLFTFSPAQSGLDATDLVWISERSRGSLSIPRRPLFEAMLEFDQQLASATIAQLQTDSFWSQLAPSVQAVVVDVTTSAELELNDPASVQLYVQRFLKLLRRIYLVGSARRINDQAALAASGGAEALLSQHGFHHPTIAARAAASVATGSASRPLRADIERRALEQQYGLGSGE
jgi:hypothetical protein